MHHHRHAVEHERGVERGALTVAEHDDDRRACTTRVHERAGAAQRAREVAPAGGRFESADGRTERVRVARQYLSAARHQPAAIVGGKACGDGARRALEAGEHRLATLDGAGAHGLIEHDRHGDRRVSGPADGRERPRGRDHEGEHRQQAEQQQQAVPHGALAAMLALRLQEEAHGRKLHPARDAALEQVDQQRDAREGGERQQERREERHAIGIPPRPVARTIARSGCPNGWSVMASA